MPRVPKNDHKKARHWIPCPKCSGEGKRLNTKGQMAVCPTCHGMKGKYV
jgi:DnaJ-class molecular chaperone